MVDWYPFEENKLQIMREAYRRRPKTILELGAYVGEDSLILGALCDKGLTCIEGRKENAVELQRRLDDFALRARIIVADFETYRLSGLGWFDCVWASGVLYHVVEPWALIAKIAGVCPLCLGWTHVAQSGDAESRGWLGQWWNEDTDKPLAGLCQRSFWLTEEQFVNAWAQAGMACKWLTPRKPHPNGGLAAQFVAERR